MARDDIGAADPGHYGNGGNRAGQRTDRIDAAHSAGIGGKEAGNMSKLHFHYGVMSAGKSTQLIQAHYNFTNNDVHCLAVKPIIDSRVSESKIVSRIGIECPAVPMDKLRVRNIIKKYDASVILIDEVQFFDSKSIDCLVDLADSYGKIVMCYGLMIDSNGQMFDAAKRLLESGATLHKLRTSCEINRCMNLATHHLRFDINGQVIRKGQQICVGDSNYKSVCRPHFYEYYKGKGK